jgi:hypothetical protein
MPDSAINTPTISEVSGTCPVYPSGDVRQIAHIRGLTCDNSDNLYAWDEEYHTVWKFSSTGKIIFKKIFGSGECDSCINVAKDAFAVSGDGLICIGGFMKKTLTILDSNGNFKNRFKIKLVPNSVTFGKDNSIYVTGFPFTYRGPIIHHYSLTGEFLGSFCERDEITELNKLNGYSGRLITDSNGDIYYASFYPYRIGVYSPEGKQEKIIERKVEGFVGMESKVNANKNHQISSGLRGVNILNNKYITVISALNAASKNWSLDFFDVEGKYKFSIPNSKLPNYFYMGSWAADSKGFIYFTIEAHDDTFIVKYKIDYDKLSQY